MNVRMITVFEDGLSLDKTMIPMLLATCSGLPLFENDVEFELDYTAQYAQLTVGEAKFTITFLDIELKDIPAINDPDFEGFWQKIHVVLASNSDGLPSKEQAVPLFQYLLQVPVDINNVVEHMPHRSEVFKLDEIQPFSVLVPEFNGTDKPFYELIHDRAEANPDENVKVKPVH